MLAHLPSGEGSRAVIVTSWPITDLSQRHRCTYDAGVNPKRKACTTSARKLSVADWKRQDGLRGVDAVEFERKERHRVKGNKMNLFKQYLFLTASLTCSMSHAGSQDPSVTAEQTTKTACIKQPGFIGGPFVPTARAARLIYLAVADEIAPGLLKQYPIVIAQDRGDHWDVSQTRHEPPYRPRPGEVVVSAGGGQLYMQIDKCSGAISGAAFNR